MKNAFITLILVLTSVFVSSFTEITSGDFIGTYGVSETDRSQIKLEINSDHTFTFQDFSDIHKKIKVSGTWTQRRNKVILKNNSAERFHHVWTFTSNGRVAKSRLGLCFYRLGKVSQ